MAKTNIDITKYLKDHIPYSIDIMLSHCSYINNYHEKIIDDNQILNGVFVGSLTKGRMLLEVIGIKLNTGGVIQNSPKIFKDEPGEDNPKVSVYADTLRGKLANIDELNKNYPNEMENIRHYLIAANKYELHLTKQRHKRDLIKYNKAIPFILRLIDEHIYLANAENIKIRQELINTNPVFAKNFNTTNQYTPSA